MSLFSPFPFGSPMSRMNSFQTSFSGSPGQKMLLGTSLHNQSRTVSDEVRQVMTPRLKGQDIYGGPVMFGNSARKSRLLSSSPYTAALQSRTREKQSKLDRSNFLPSLGMIPPPRPPSSLPSTAPSSPHSSPGPSSSSSPPAQLSTSAQIILSTLEKINKSGTPVTDARKIPLISPSRAEKRKFLESELNSSINSGSPSRRRRRLGGGGLALSGPPLRKNFSPSVNLSNSSSTSSPLSDSTTLSVTRSQVSTPLSSKTVSLETRTRDESSSGLSRQSSKSGLKMKSKVVETGRSSSVSAAPEAPSFSLPATAQLQVEQMPVFNFVSAPDTRNAASVSSEKQSAVTPAVAPPSVSPVKSDVKSDDPETNNNDKSPVKRSYQDSCESAACSVKKVKSSEDAGSVSLELDNNITSYKFSEPRPVIDSSGVKPLVSTSVRYSFSAPSPVRSSPETIVGRWKLFRKWIHS